MSCRTSARSALVALLILIVGARTASRIDAPADDEQGGCGQDCNCGAPAETPAVDVAALRRAASEADKN